MKTEEIWFEITPAQAEALARLVKRITFSEVQSCAVDKDEAYTMLEALDQLREGLAQKGYQPR